MKPKPYKLALLTWSAIYPSMTVLFALAGPYLQPLPLPLRTLVLTGCVVPFVVLLVMPILIRRFHNWLTR